jgi:hypothetical protein
VSGPRYDLVPHVGRPAPAQPEPPEPLPRPTRPAPPTPPTPPTETLVRPYNMADEQAGFYDRPQPVPEHIVRRARGSMHAGFIGSALACVVVGTWPALLVTLVIYAICWWRSRA